jgi:hypothetical protein
MARTNKKEIQVLEVSGTNLLYIVLENNTVSAFYEKKNLEVYVEDGLVVMEHNGIVIFRERARDFIDPKTTSETDMAEIIQGYINNVIPENQEEVDLLKNLVNGQEVANSLLDLIKLQSNRSEEIINELKIMNAHLTLVNGQEIHL